MPVICLPISSLALLPICEFACQCSQYSKVSIKKVTLIAVKVNICVDKVNECSQKVEVNMIVFSPSISGLQCLPYICGDYAAEHNIAFNCSKTIGVLFCLKKYKQPVPSNVFLNNVHVQFFDQVKYLGVWINASLKDDDLQRQVKLLYCATNKLTGIFDQCSPAVKNTLYHSYYMSVIACQLWSKYTQTNMKRLCAAYNNAY